MRITFTRLRCFHSLLAAAGLSLIVAVPAYCQAAHNLDEMTKVLAIKQGWGGFGVNTAAFAPGGPPPLTLRIADKDYTRGLGHHAPGEIAVPLSGQYTRFQAEVGVQWQGGGRGSVVFQVWVDGEQRFDSGKMTDSDAAKPVDIPLTGAGEMKLVATDSGDGFSCDMANWADARLTRDPAIPEIAQPVFLFGGAQSDGDPGMEGSYALIGHSNGAQAAFSRPLGACTVAATPTEDVRLTINLAELSGPYTVTAEAELAGGTDGETWIGLASGETKRVRLSGGKAQLVVDGDGKQASNVVTLGASAINGDYAVRWSHVQYHAGNATIDIDLLPPPLPLSTPPTPRDVALNPVLEGELIVWDWCMQDGIGAGQTRNSFESATQKTLERGDRLIADLQDTGIGLDGAVNAWVVLRQESDALRAAQADPEDVRWENLWLRVHEARRALVFANPLAQTGPLLFVKQAPGMFSHQLTQYYGRYARPGGGVFALDRPGASMQVRPLAAGAFPQGSYMHPEVTHDGTRVLVAFCAVDAPPQDTFKGQHGLYYHLYDMAADGSGVRELTDGAFDDFAPKELPNGQIIFISTRRGGWHRCGTPGCEVYTLTLMNPDGTNIRTVSYHETQEWDPAVLNDGRVIYTRWDYVDRNAVFYEQLWSVRPDGAAPAAFYGNNTFNPVGIWEPRAVPGSQRVMATAAPHHGMTAGSIILVDPTRGVDGPGPITRLTPDTPFPESEAVLLPQWRSAVGTEPPNRTPDMDRWPGQCFRSPWPLSEKYFLAAFSYDPLVGEPKNNAANIFGLYLVDAFGNQELIYRDLNIASVWPLPLAPRAKAPELPSMRDETTARDGTYFLQDVYDSNPGLEQGTVKRLRIVQVLPKSTSGANNPTVGAANASPGKQVLGTVPVEADGSACFRAPAGIALAFQALDDLGQAAQVMRSVTYLQPGENASCVGCHEPRLSAPAVKTTVPLATQRPPSTIMPGPDGSNPLSYPILVQPVLDNHCVRCHAGAKPAGPKGAPVVLTGEAAGRYTTSYNALIERVSYSAWGRGTFPDGNSEPLAQPGFFGAKGSPLMKMLLAGHHNVTLSPDELDRLITWTDANALFYGTFFPEEQAKQQRGERIAGPGLE
jgi:hypothetical protein